jgi:hypothetical protein
MAMGLCPEAVFKRLARRERVSPDAHEGPSTDQVIVTFRSYAIAPPRLTVRLQRVLAFSWFTNDPV